MKTNNIDDVFHLVRSNQLEELKLNVNASNVNQFVNEYQQNLLHETISRGSLQITEYLIECNIDVNKSDKDGKVPLHYSTAFNNYEITKLLLEKDNIEKDVKDIHGNNPLWVAVFNAKRFYDVVKILKQHGADPNSKNNSNRSPLDFAKQIEDEDLVEILTS
ncbi:ankyrin repeat domain-containing protein [Chryseobacterium lathyri]|uniref:ankyrin repeat domain-containing protein n=1 Tax=Chryseobacterium lathyri TaxID=395933 RepID=UPI001CBDADB3|nr:ankyrin repeat domain-containing protein [Chryseobacterium lathyri]